jgi:hypothetical protein
MDDSYPCGLCVGGGSVIESLGDGSMISLDVLVRDMFIIAILRIHYEISGENV